jgi:hypothetical protein
MGEKISDLPASGGANPTDLFESNQGGTSRKLTLQQMLAGVFVSPTFTGDPKAPTPAPTDNDQSIATTAFVKAAIAGLAFAPVASPVFTGDPQAPTPALADNDQSIATTGFVKQAINAVSWRLVQRTVPAAGAGGIDFLNIPADINDIRIHFDLLPATNDAEFLLQFYDGSSVLITTGYLYGSGLAYNAMALAAAIQGSGSTATGITSGIGLTFGNAGNRVGSAAAYGISGDILVNNIRDATRAKRAQFRAGYINGNATYFMSVVGAGTRNAVGAISGARLSFSGVNMAAGGYASLWGSP